MDFANKNKIYYPINHNNETEHRSENDHLTITSRRNRTERNSTHLGTRVTPDPLSH